MMIMRIVTQSNGLFTVEIVTPKADRSTARLPAPAADTIQLFRDQTYDQLFFRIQDAFPQPVVAGA